MDITETYSQTTKLLQEIRSSCLQAKLTKPDLQADIKNYNINTVKMNTVKQNIARMREVIENIDEDTNNFSHEIYEKLKHISEVPLNLPELYNVLTKMTQIKKKLPTECVVVDNMEATIVCEPDLENI